MSNHRLSQRDRYKIKLQLAEKYGFWCQYCGRNGNEVKLTIHHIVKYAETQDNSLENLILLCVDCHEKGQ